MTEKRFWRPSVMASLVAAIGLLAAPVSPSVTWAASAAATSAPQVLIAQTPTTLDSYLAYLQDRLNAEAMKVHTPGVANVKLTIGKDGSVQRTEVERLEGPSALHDQITSMISQINFPRCRPMFMPMRWPSTRPWPSTIQGPVCWIISAGSPAADNLHRRSLPVSRWPGTDPG
jgi:hypothetical protein